MLDPESAKPGTLSGLLPPTWHGSCGLWNYPCTAASRHRGDGVHVQSAAKSTAFTAFLRSQQPPKPLYMENINVTSSRYKVTTCRPSRESSAAGCASSLELLSRCIHSHRVWGDHQLRSLAITTADQRRRALVAYTGVRCKVFGSSHDCTTVSTDTHATLPVPSSVLQWTERRVFLPFCTFVWIREPILHAELHVHRYCHYSISTTLKRSGYCDLQTRRRFREP